MRVGRNVENAIYSSGILDDLYIFLGGLDWPMIITL